MRFKACIFVLFLGSYSYVYSQVGFYKSFGRLHNDYGTSVIQTFDGGYLIGGATYSGSDSDIFIVKTNFIGDTLWTRIFPSTGNEIVVSVLQTPDSGFAILADASDLVNSHNILLLRINHEGNFLWAKQYGDGYDMPYAFIKTHDNGFCIVGASDLLPGMSSRSLIIRTNEIGDTLWTKKYYSDPYFSIAFDIKETHDSNFVILSGLYQLDSNNPLLVKISPSGTIMNTVSINYTIDGINIRSMAEANDGSIIFTAHGFETHVLHHGFFSKIDSNFNVVWWKFFATLNVDPVNVIIDDDGSYIFQGKYNHLNTNKNFIIRTDTSGQVLSAYEYPFASGHSGNSFHQTSDGGYISCGTMYDSIQDDNRISIFKISSSFNNCNMQSLAIGNTLNGTSGFSGPLDTSSGITILSKSFIGLTGCNQITHCLITDLQDNSVVQSSVLAYPNPSNTKFTFKSIGGIRKVEIKNLSGQCIHQSTINEIDLSDYSNGIYFYSVVTENGSMINGKLIKE